MRCRYPRSLLLVFAGLGALALRAADDSVVALPPFIVEEAGNGPPWRYAGVAGFEVLSRCPEATTRELIETFFRLHQLMAEILPENLQVKLSVPRTLIFYDQAGASATSQEVIAQMLRNMPASARNDLVLADRGRRGPTAPSSRFQFMPNLRLWDRDAMAVFSLIEDGGFDGQHLALTSDYAAFLVHNRLPALPLWYVTGFLSLYNQVKFDGDQVKIAAAEWMPSPPMPPPEKKAEAESAPRNAPPGVVMPLADFFAADIARFNTAGIDPARWWKAQATLLVRWGLDGKNAPRRAGFWRLAEQAAVHPMTEKLFQECLGLDYATAERQLAAYWPGAMRRAVTLKRPRHAPLPRFEIRLATDVEISRIKGDWERMEIGFVKARFPAVAPKYLEQARRTLRRAYDHDSRDPQLLAVLGLCEVDAGDDAAAREYLEAAAVRSTQLRPRAWFELARLRFADERIHPAAPDDRLSAAQAGRVLTPLFAARALQPPLPEVYELIAEVWAHSAFAPTREHLAVVNEGVLLFPHRSELVYRDAVLNLKQGYGDQATWLVELGLKLAPDDATRDRFGQLQAQLESAAR